MSELFLYNTMTRRVERFVPRTAGRVRFFSCGPSVYRRQHLGNYRTYLFADVLHRYLAYRGLKVARLINITDVEDKAVDEAGKRDTSVAARQRPIERAFFDECRQLSVQLPRTVPRASASVDAAVRLIERLLDRGHAYRHEGEVFFDPLTYEGFGRIFGLDMKSWPEKRRRFRQDTYPGQRWNRGDFILWHRPREDNLDITWETSIGPGRPSWNLQDAAMIRQHLGDEIDVHTGGVDNLYRHHDYTLAVMEGATGKPFCPYWVHGGHLLKDGRKMSKSRGNVSFLGDLLRLGFEPRHVRFFLLYAPYRETLEFHLSGLEQRAGLLDRVRRLRDALLQAGRPASPDKGPDFSRFLRDDFQARMNDNLDVRGAFDAVAGHLARAVALDRDRGINPDRRASLNAAVTEVDSVLCVF